MSDVLLSHVQMFYTIIKVDEQKKPVPDGWMGVAIICSGTHTMHSCILKLFVVGNSIKG